MLAAARHRLGELDNVELRSGALESLPIDDDALDAATSVLVLHHVAEPARVAREAGIQVNVNVTNGDFKRINLDLRHWRYRPHQTVRARGDLWRSLTNIPCRVRL